jgi:GcrA cell cycle regulator
VSANEQPWSPEDLGTLRELWTLGHSSSKIGRLMRRSRNSIIGKAHRINLPARPGPIRRGSGGNRKIYAKADRVISALHDLVAVCPNASPAVAAAPAPVAPPTYAWSTRGCCFPLWPDGMRPLADWAFCDAPVTFLRTPSGKSIPGSYCREHQAATHTRVPAARSAKVFA